MSHTPEPWAFEQEIEVRGNALNIVHLMTSSEDDAEQTAKDNLERMRVCVNAMAGIDDPVGFMSGLRDVLRNFKLHAHLNRRAENLATVDININLTRDAAAILSRMGDA